MTKLLLKILALASTGLFTYWIKNQISISSSSAVLQAVGGGIAVIAIIYLIAEKRLNLPFFYGSSQSGGSNANGSIIAGLAIGLIATSYLYLFVSVVGGGIIVLTIDSVIKVKIIDN